MGIGGLLPLLKEIQKPAHVRDWAGKTVAVDGYVWLHRGAYGCAEDLALGKPTTKYVNYAMHRVRMLRHFGVTPLLVFDGGLLPSKMGTEDARQAKRANALARGRAFLAEGRGVQARECFVKAVDITPAMAFQLIKVLQRERVQYVVAPYEADPQLAYLERVGLVDAVITEDSDLLVFGCRNVLFKLDGEGKCVSISRDDFARCREYNFSGWSDTEFRHMAILSGCDYLDSVVGLGLKTAHRLLRKYKTPEKVIQFVRLEGQLTVPRTYLDDFRRAEQTFLHQYVFDPEQRVLTHLTPLPDGTTVEDLPFIGPVLDADFARGVADGRIDPVTKLAMVDLVPDPRGSAMTYCLAHSLGRRKLSLFDAATFPAAGSNVPQVFARKTSYLTLRTQPFEQQPFKRARAPTDKPAGPSLLSYFSVAPAAPASTASKVPVRTSKLRAKVGPTQAASAASNGKTVDAKKQEPRRSKFFGAAAPDDLVVVNVRGTQTALLGNPAIDGPAETLGLAADDSGFLECSDLASCSDDVDAEEAMRDMQMDELPQVDVVGAAAAVTALEKDEAHTHSDESEVRLHGPPAASTPAISSPPATPPRKRVKRSHTLSHTLSPIAEPAHAPLSDAAISSPSQSTCAQAGWDQDELSSPAPAAPVKSRHEVTSRPPEVIRKQTRHATPTIQLSSDPIVLSSSPEAPALRPPSASRGVKSARKPKAPVRSSQGKVKSPLRRSNVVGAQVHEDEGILPPLSLSTVVAGKKSQGRDKKRNVQVHVDEEDEGRDEAAKALAASWRAKFMMPVTNKTPLGRTAADRGNSLTPRTATRPAPSEWKIRTDAVPQSKSLSATLPSKRSASMVDAQRIPLSPKSHNRISTAPPPRKSSQLGLELPLSPSRGAQGQRGAATTAGAKKRRLGLPDRILTSSSSSGGVLSSEEDRPKSDSFSSSASSSSPIVVTNPRLLSFRFTGSVRRD